MMLVEMSFFGWLNFYENVECEFIKFFVFYLYVVYKITSKMMILLQIYLYYMLCKKWPASILKYNNF